MERMKGKVAIITGATSGIGKETALLFAKHGIKVALAGRNEKAGAELVTEIHDNKGEALFVKTDVGHANSVIHFIESAKKHFGGIDYAFNNAGIEGKLELLADIEEKDWDEVMNINLKGVWLSMKYVLPAILDRGGGSIVNTSTNLTAMGVPTTAIYTASKAGVNALTQVAATEYGKYGVRVNAINPGAVDTPLLHRVYTPEVKEQIKKTNPLGTIATPHDVAGVALWLCSPLAGHINGVSLFIDGGHSLVG